MQKFYTAIYLILYYTIPGFKKNNFQNLMITLHRVNPHYYCTMQWGEIFLLSIFTFMPLHFHEIFKKFHSVSMKIT